MYNRDHAGTVAEPSSSSIDALHAPLHTHALRKAQHGAP